MMSSSSSNSNSDDASIQSDSNVIREVSLSKGSSSAEQSSSSGNDSNKKERFVQRESLYVLYLRLLVLLVLLMAAAAVCVVVYLITSNSEEDSFASNYEAAADKVLNTFMDIAEEKMGAAGSMVVSIVAEGLALQDPWPFVTMASFQERAATVMKLSGALYIGMNPIVTHENRLAWENYTNHGEAAEWYAEGRAYQEQLGFDDLDNRPQVNTKDPRLNLTSGVANYIYDFDRYGTDLAVVSPDEAAYLPIWQTSPVTRRTMVNQNRNSNSNASARCIREMEVVFEGMEFSTPGYGDDPNPVTAEFAWLLRIANRQRTHYDGDIFSAVYFPLFSNFSAQRQSVGAMRIVIQWARYFRNILPASTQGVVVVLENQCQEPYTYRIDGPKVIPVGHGDQHDHRFDEYERMASFANISKIEDGTSMGMILDQDKCVYSIRVYPSAIFVNTYTTQTPSLITFSVACVFIFAVIMFFVYDRLVERRQSILMRKAMQTHQIVASLFPKNIRDQMLQESDANNKKNGGGGTLLGGNSRLKNFLTEGNDDRKAPIADLYPNATVLFADISGFTAWSSSREPAQVFILLQSVYQAFDVIAKRRRVFKVETIGDSYVAVTGLPDPQPNHAIIMARFATECILKMADVARSLETKLGPDTGELMMRFGLHSGPVTAGVLRGERSRFQLFGDTVNTAARMESTGMPGKIQCSQSTAELLIRAGKGHWVNKREDSVMAKGKGVLTTFWLTPYAKKAASAASSETNSSDLYERVTQQTPVQGDQYLKYERHVDWMVILLQESIRQIVAQRVACKKKASPLTPPDHTDGAISLDEVVEAIQLPEFDSKAAMASAAGVEIPANITASLKRYVSIIASAYRDNHFHNFEHACHVTMSVSKFLSRIVTPEIEIEQLTDSMNNKDINNPDKIAKQIASHLHDYTHGITSDPVTILAIVFSALIHDVDHRGVSNVQLMKEEPAMATMFRNKSIAEQNSLDIAWELLMSDSFQELREFIFINNEDLMRFRQVVVNVVLATDIFDKELNELRRARWSKAFADDSDNSTLSKSVCGSNSNALRATIVMEHIMQASDVCHTMQHWHIYRKWNQRLFFEMLTAFRTGRMGADPAGFWYKGELGFFDNYIIPLAGKLKDCNVFGVSSDECLNYALRNRAEWEARGEDLVAEMLEDFNQQTVLKFTNQ